ncbi:unnamed protein product, partial [Ostreobium quekettii]
VVVHTSDEKGAGTDSRVFVDLIGDAGSSGAQQLVSSKKNPFERGDEDEFVLQVPASLGNLTHLRVCHDGKGFGAGWHLDYIAVTDVADQQVYYFLCQRWLDKSKDDGKTERTLAASRHFPIAEYDVSVATSDVRGSGTDANVFIEIHGEESATRRFVLETPAKNDFERGATDKFVVRGRNVGIMTKVVVGHDNKGLGPAWHLHRVDVTNRSTGQVAGFVADRWFSKSHDDKQIVRELMPTESAHGEPTGGASVPWRAVVVTGDVRGAGTDADVFLDLRGAKGTSGPMMLEAAGDVFERGQRDAFRLRAPDVGPLREIEVSHNGKGRGPDWYLDSIELTDESSGRNYLFLAQRWLKSSKGTSASATLRPEEGGGAAHGRSRYRVEVTTAWRVGRDLKGPVAVRASGTGGDSGERNLDGGAAVHLRPGATDAFHLDRMPDVGQMSTLEVRHGFKAAWCGVVRVVNEDTGAQGVFVQEGMLGMRDCPARLQAEGRDPCDYQVEVKTSNLRGAGTDSSVSITLHGASRATGPHPLETRSKNTFERGSLDRFTLDALPHLGDLTKITIGHDGKGFGAGWHLEGVKVARVAGGDSWYFPCRRWLDKGEDEGRTTRVLLVEDTARRASNTDSEKDHLEGMAVRSRAPVGHTGYRITFWTSNVWLAGTSAQVFFELVGESISSGVLIPAQGKPDDQFARGTARMFIYPRLPYLGDIKELRVGLDGSGVFPGWHLRVVEVEHIKSGATWRFHCHGWIDKRGGWQRVLYPEESVLLSHTV